MGTNYSRNIEYRCIDDCVQSGCPSHRMQLAYHRTTNVLSVIVDGELYASFDDNALKSFRELLNEISPEPKV